MLKNAFLETFTPFDFSKIVEDAAIQGDEVANDILKGAASELFKNVIAGYEKGDFESKPYCDLLLSGSVLTHSKITRYFLEDMIKEKYPNVYVGGELLDIDGVCGGYNMQFAWSCAGVIANDIISKLGKQK